MKPLLLPNHQPIIQRLKVPLMQWYSRLAQLIHPIKLHPHLIYHLSRLFDLDKSSEKYTPIGEPYSSVLEKLIKAGAITLPPIKPHTGFDPARPMPAWYKEHDFCNYHRVKGHSDGNCITFKNIVQEILEK
ncbi:hypothetical protein KI387_014875, partial [Taxus chinensis]